MNDPTPSPPKARCGSHVFSTERSVLTGPAVSFPRHLHTLFSPSGPLATKGYAKPPATQGSNLSKSHQPQFLAIDAHLALAI
jgi:hypothetical protein